MGNFINPKFIPRIVDFGVITRFLDKIQAWDEGCWDWHASLDNREYGQFWYDGRCHRAHRISYAIFKGPVEAGMVIDHTCHNHGCCCPDHIDKLTIIENGRINQHHDRYKSTQCSSGSSGVDEATEDPGY